MSELNKYMSLKKKVEEAHQSADKAEGALGQIMNQLEDSFQCSTLKAAKLKLISLQKQEKKITKEFKEAVEDFEEKWEN